MELNKLYIETAEVRVDDGVGCDVASQVDREQRDKLYIVKGEWPAEGRAADNGCMEMRVSAEWDMVGETGWGSQRKGRTEAIRKRARSATPSRHSGAAPMAGRDAKCGSDARRTVQASEKAFLERTEYICGLIWELFPQTSKKKLEIMSLVVEAYHVADEDYGVLEAVNWAEGFTWPPDISERDEKRIREAGSLTAAVASIQQRYRPFRLSRERIMTWVDSSDEDFDRLIDLAEGMRVLVDSEFVPNEKPPPLRNMYKRAASAVNKLLHEWWLEDLAMVVRTSTLVAQPGVHFSPAHWTTKAGKREGRVLFDSSDDSHGPSLNSDSAREKLRARYGEIAHPTLDDFVLMVLDSEAQHPESLEELVLWKWDLRKAFTLLSFRPEDARLLACELTDDLSLVYHAGLFGWTGTPFAFQVISRTLHKLLSQRGVSQLVYVDDIGGACRQDILMNTKATVRTVTEGLLGPKALAEQKWESGRRLDFIGWEVDLDTRRVSLKRRNFLKVLHGFFAVDLNAKWTGRLVERLASWASRYAAVLRHLRPFSDDLYGELKGWKNRDAAREIRPRGKRAVVMWRVVLCAAYFDDNRVTRPLESFRVCPPDVTIAYDASLTGVGVGIETIGGELVLLYSAQFPFDLGADASFQNTAEFIAVVLGCGMLVSLGWRSARIHLKGDSMTSLVWGSTERFKGDLCTAAAICYVLIGMDYDLQVVSTEHVRGIDNQFYDSLSRRPEMKTSHAYPWVESTAVDELLHYCNPTISLLDPAEVAPLWQGVKSWIARVGRIA